MGVWIFLTLIAIEIAVANFCIITKSKQIKTRSIIRIAEFLIFVLFFMLSIFVWSFRYYPLALVVSARAVLGVTSLPNKKEKQQPVKTSHIVSNAIGVTFLLFVAILPVLLFPQYETLDPTGSYHVSTADYSYTDTKRIEPYGDAKEPRKLNVTMWFPKDTKEKFPLIVFSHGAFGMKNSNISLYNELASHGYVVCSIDHTYQCLYTKGEDGQTIFMDKGYMREISTENAHSNKEQSFKLYQKWMKIRTDDMNFVIDHILAEAKKADADMAYSFIDPTKIGVIGHSLGGSASLGIGRMRDDVSSVIALESPFMCDITGVKDGSFVFTDAEYPIPILHIYSDQGWGLLSSAPQYAENYALLSTDNPTTFNVHIEGIGHLSLTDLSLVSPFLTRMFNGHRSKSDATDCLETINRVSLDFFDSYVKREHQFMASETY